MIRAIKFSLAASVLALGFAGTALADRHDGRHDRGDRHERRYDHDRRHDGRYDGRYEGRYDRRDDRRHFAHRHYHRHEHRAPVYQQRWRAPAPRGWHRSWYEPYGRNYRYWQDGYYYVVPSRPTFELSLVLPLR